MEDLGFKFRAPELEVSGLGFGLGIRSTACGPWESRVCRARVYRLVPRKELWFRRSAFMGLGVI